MCKTLMNGMLPASLSLSLFSSLWRDCKCAYGDVIHLFSFAFFLWTSHPSPLSNSRSSSPPSSSQPCRQNDVENKRRRKGSTYELVGVLIHVGPGANVGHYIAHIKDDVCVFPLPRWIHRHAHDSELTCSLWLRRGAYVDARAFVVTLYKPSGRRNGGDLTTLQ
jgi:hypothetical protein